MRILEALHRMIIGALAILALSSAIWLGNKSYSEKKWQEKQERILQIARPTQPEAGASGKPQPGAVTSGELPDASEPAAAGQAVPVDFGALRLQNSDTVAWIWIPDTNIDYPIVQAEDNDFYLRRDFFGDDDTAGTIFLDFESAADFHGFHQIIYGHHMKNGTMFHDLEKFRDEDYFSSHPYFYIYTPERTICLKTVACYDTDDDPVLRQTHFDDEEGFAEFVRRRLTPCSFARVPDEVAKPLYTLVTCSYENGNSRTVLLAVEETEELNANEIEVEE